MTVGSEEIHLIVLDHSPILPRVSGHDKGPSQGLVVAVLTEEGLLEKTRVIGFKLFQNFNCVHFALFVIKFYKKYPGIRYHVKVLNINILKLTSIIYAFMIS